MLVSLSESDPVVISTASAGWLLGFPLMDAVSVMVRRILSGQSAFVAGRDHFHHRLLDAGLSSRQCLLVIVAMHSVFVGLGIFSNFIYIPGYLLFYIFVGVTFAFHYKVDKLVAVICRITGSYSSQLDKLDIAD